jgi:zinc transporter ZupT
LGLLLAYFFLQSQEYQSAAGCLLALSAGTFVYIGACDLLPELHRASGEKLKRLAVFILGLLISYGSGALLEHHH